MKFKSKRDILLYSDNCGICKHCTIPNFDRDINPALCPICKSDLCKIKIVPTAHWKNNIVECPNGHEYDILDYCDKDDIKLHQNTIDKLNGK